MKQTQASLSFWERKLAERLARAGIQLNGERPFDPRMLDARAARAVVLHGSVGAGEAYMNGWWDAQDLVGMFKQLFTTGEADSFSQFWCRMRAFRSRVRNLQSKARAWIVAREHYDLGNDFYALWLDKTMAYTCGYWREEARSLEDAQIAKYDLVCRKLGFERGQRVLEIGCGWGGFAKYAAETYGVQVVGVSLSVEQSRMARERCEGLPVEIRIQDYREVSDGPYDHIVSIGMFEAVGSRNFRKFMRKLHRLLKPGGSALLHTIGTTFPYPTVDPWFHRYIFPNGELPSRESLVRACRGWLAEVDFHEFPADYYARTLQAWYSRFDVAWPRIRSLDSKYDERFRRMWKYYLLSMVAAFSERRNVLWQLVLCREEDVGSFRAYDPVR